MLRFLALLFLVPAAQASSSHECANGIELTSPTCHLNAQASGIVLNECGIVVYIPNRFSCASVPDISGPGGDVYRLGPTNATVWIAEGGSYDESGDDVLLYDDEDNHVATVSKDGANVVLIPIVY